MLLGIFTANYSSLVNKLDFGKSLEVSLSLSAEL